MYFFRNSSVFTIIGFIAGFVSNMILIHLTVFHIKKVTGTYKIMVIAFAVMGIFFSGWELISKPFMHNYNKSLVYFSLNMWPGVPKEFFQFGIAFYAAIYDGILSFIAIQFVYRYLTLFNENLAKYFDGKYVIFWLIYPALPGFIYASSFYLYCAPDSYSDEYVRSKMMIEYEMQIENVPRFVIVSYNEDGSFRWNNIRFLVQGVSVLGFHYCLIIYFGLQMQLHMKKKLKDFSSTYQRLQKQFFLALVVQTLAPTVLFVIPACPILLGPIFSPIFGIDIDLQTEWLCSVFSLYPPIDSIAFMLIVTEYKNILRGRCQVIFAKSATVSAQVSSTENRSRPV